MTYKTDDNKEKGEVELEMGMEMPSTKKISLKAASGIALRYPQTLDERLPPDFPPDMGSRPRPYRFFGSKKSSIPPS